jgi:heptosyltransferase-3
LTQRENAGDWLQNRRRYPQRALIGISPSSKQMSNRWSTQNFLHLVKRLDMTSQYEIIFFGGGNDINFCDELSAACQSNLNAAGKFDIWGSAALMSHCNFMISLCTGPLHLAASIGVKCIDLQSARSHRGKWDPFGDQNLVIRRDVKCSPCGQSVCDVDGHPCMEEITVEDVMNAINIISTK